MTKAGKRLIKAAEEAKQIARYPYTHHGPPVYGDKLTDFLISEANMIEDGLIPDPHDKEPK
jgi:hypothetical protein